MLAGICPFDFAQGRLGDCASRKNATGSQVLAAPNGVLRAPFTASQVHILTVSQEFFSLRWKFCRSRQM
jgi:hypothetical protein